MRTPLFLLGSLLLFPTGSQALVVATYNVENYTAANRMTDSGFRTEYPKPENAKKALLATLMALEADVLVLQEMGSLPYLEELQHDLRMLGRPYPHRFLVEADDADRHLAALARVPWVRAAAHRDLEFKYLAGLARPKRGLLELVFATPAGPLTVWGVHLKSRFTDHSEDPGSALRRAGEAVVIRDLILARRKAGASDLFLLLGDFNDLRHARPLRACLTRGKTPICGMLPAADSRGEVWTRFHRKDDAYERVDFILCSPGLQPHVRNGSAVIADIPAVLQASDHRPVSVTLDFR